MRGASTPPSSTPHAATDDALPGTTSSDPAARATQQAPNVLALTVVDHVHRPLVGAFEVLTPGLTATIGRAYADLLPGVFDYGRVSRKHARIEVRQGGVSVADLGSHNGTFINDQRITTAPLGAGDLLRIGDATLLCHVRPAAAPRARHPSIIGVGVGLGLALREVELVASYPTTVALVGETGVGKEVFARALHEASGRSGAMVALNCGGVSDTLVTSELFGHIKGAFTGADRRRSGLIETARGGTLFLDEIMDASPGLQAVLLRLFETGEYRAVGSDHTEHADVRFVVAAQPEIEDRIAERRFRLDLWARLARWVIRIPPLRERQEDIGALAHHFATHYAGSPVRFQPELLRALIQHPWPGNVRELQGLVERLVIAQKAQTTADGLELQFAPALFARKLTTPASGTPATPPATTSTKTPPSKASVRPGADALRSALAEHGGNVRATAIALGVGRKTLYRWLEAHAVDLASVRAADPDDDGEP